MPLTQSDIKGFEGCKSLELYDIESLHEAVIDPSLEVLHLNHFHRADTLSLRPLKNLSGLRMLSLSTTPSWDGSGRTLFVDSFEHFSNCTKLEMIQIIGVVPREGRLEPLERLKNLRVASIGNTHFLQH